MLICKHCFLDAEIQSEVEANATSEGACDVCHKQGKVIDSVNHQYSVRWVE